MTTIMTMIDEDDDDDDKKKKKKINNNNLRSLLCKFRWFVRDP